MTSKVGDFALFLTLVAGGYAVIVGFVGAFRRRDLATRSAEGALQGAAVAITVASAALLFALFRKDFSLEYVSQYTNRDLSMFYTLAAFWAGQAGSLLLWAWLLGLASALVTIRNRRKLRDLMPWVVPILGTVLVFFTVLTLFYANPFTRLPTLPPDGQGLNPLLQNYGQWVHPIALYAGWVGFTIPFAFAIAALITGGSGDSWVRSVRPWAMWSWILLTAGILFGARWAYVELGWGGYWAWDPVENASLMPWFVATAYLHAAVVQEKRGMMKVWTTSLITATFALSIFGTFLTRSGVISSVHAFAESTMGPLLIGFTLLIVAASTALMVWRLPQLRSTSRYGSILSRESSFLVTNLLLVAMTVVVFWGTVYPLVSQSVKGVEVAVGPPFFEHLMAPLAILLMIVVGMCPLLAWRRADAAHLKRNFKVPVLVGTITLASLLMLTRGRHLGVVATVSLAAFVLTTVAAEIRRGLHARRAVHGESFGRAIHHLFAFTPRRYGGPIVHAGIVVLVTGIAINVAFKQSYESTLKVGTSSRAGASLVVFRELRFQQDASKFALIGTFDVTDPSGALHTIVAQQVEYADQQNTTEVGIDVGLGGDLYLVMSNADPGRQVATIQFFVEPGVFWIWVGMVIVVLGGVLAAWPWRPKLSPTADEDAEEPEADEDPALVLAASTGDDR